MKAIKVVICNNFRAEDGYFWECNLRFTSGLNFRDRKSAKEDFKSVAKKLGITNYTFE